MSCVNRLAYVVTVYFQLLENATAQKCGHENKKFNYCKTSDPRHHTIEMYASTKVARLLLTSKLFSLSVVVHFTPVLLAQKYVIIEVSSLYV